MPKAEVWQVPTPGTPFKRFRDGGTPAPTGIQTTIQNTNIGTGVNQVSYVGTDWTAYADDPLDNQGIHYSGATGDYLSIRFYGNKVAYYGTKETYSGILAWSIDGGTETMIDAYNNPTTRNQKVFEVVGLSEAEHILRVRVTGNKRTDAVFANVTFDNAVVTSVSAYVPPITPVTPPQPSTASDQRVIIRGGGWVRAIRFGSDGTIYAPTDTGGAYRYEAASDYWKQVVTATGRPDRSVNYYVEDMFAAPSNANRVYIASGGGTGYIHRSDDKGTTWPVRSPLISAMHGNDNPRIIHRGAVDPQNANHFLYGTRDGKLLRSIDGGTNLSEVGVPASVNNGNGAGVSVPMFVPGSPVVNGLTQVFYIGVNNVGLLKTTNGGTSFTTVISKTDSYFSDLQRASDGTIYAVAGRVGAPLFARVTPGVGAAADTWADITPTNPMRAWSTFALHPTNPGEIVVMSDGVYERDNGNGNIRRTTTAKNATVTWIDQPLTYTNGPKGTVWPRQATAIAHYMSVGNIRFSPDGTELMFAEGMGCWRAPRPTGSTIQFAFWSDGIEELVSSDATKPPGQPLVTVHWDRGIFRHPDPTNTNPSPAQAAYLPWTGEFGSAWDLAVSPTDPNYMAAVLDNHNAWEKDYLKRMSAYSENAGAIWTRFPTLVNQTHPVSDTTGDLRYGNIAISAGTGTNRDNMIWTPSEHAGGAAAYWTKNKGVTWTKVSLPGATSTVHVHQSHFLKKTPLLAHPTTPGTFYCIGNDDSNGTPFLWTTTNGGESWSRIMWTGGPQNGFWDLRFHAGIAIAGGFLMVFPGHHDGQGNPWWKAPLTNLTTGWVEKRNIFIARTPAVGPALSGSTNSTLLTYGIKAGTTVERYYYSTDLGETWTDVVAPPAMPSDLYDNPSSMTPDPEVPGKFYIGYTGCGFASTQIQVASTVPQPTGYSGSALPIIFQDEFTGTSLDTAKWNVTEPSVGEGSTSNRNDARVIVPATSNEVEVSGGIARIKGRKNATATNAGKIMTTGEMTTRARFDTFTHGYAEARMRLPKGRSLWPAFWLLGNGSNSTPPPWPETGEVDIAEFFNGQGDAGSNHTSTPLMGMHNFGHWFRPSLAPFSATNYRPTVLATDTGTTFDGRTEYSGSGWTTSGTMRQSSNTGDFVDIRFYGTRIEMFGPKGPNKGILAWSLDGGAETNVDMYQGSVDNPRNFLFGIYGASLGNHTVRIRVTGTRNGASSSNLISFADGNGGTGHESINGGAYPGIINYQTGRPWWEDGAMHTYTLKRTATEMINYLDGVPIYRSTPGQSIGWGSGPLPQKLFDTPMHIRFDLQIGGAGRYYVAPGTAGSVVIDGKSIMFDEGDLEVEYVRVWELP